MDANTENSPPRSGLRPPWKKGETGNPRKLGNGRPPNPYKKAIMKALPPDDFADAVAKACKRLNATVLTAVLDRYYPKPETEIKIQASGPDGAPLIPPVQVDLSIDTAKAIGMALASMGGAVMPKRLNGGANGNGSAHRDTEEGGG
jgi:hypothetical protein